MSFAGVFLLAEIAGLVIIFSNFRLKSFNFSSTKRDLSN